jgi:ribosomal protein S1
LASKKQSGSALKKAATKKSPADKKVSKPAAVKKPAVKKSTGGKVSRTPAKSMEDLLNQAGYQFSAPKRGDVLKGLVTEISRKMVLVDIGAKTEGVVLDKEIEAASDLVAQLKVGDQIEVFVKHPENDQGQILLSLRQAAEDKRWETFEEWLETGKAIEVKGLEVNKGGLIVQIDATRGFVPSSQFSQEFLGQMDKLVGKGFKAQVIEVDREQNRLIFSEKAISEAEELAKKDEAIKAVKVNDILDGVVSGIMPFGVFVTVSVPLTEKGDSEEHHGKVEGLIHISEISWEKVSDPNQHYKTGDKVKVQVIGIEESTGKLNLSVKRLMHDPWSGIKDRYAEGTKHSGKVIQLAPYGVLVNFEAGIDGLIHVSKMPPGREFKVGDEVDTYIEMLDVEHRRMSLGVVLTEKPVGYK